LITLREEESLRMLRSIGVTAPETHVTADAAFGLPPADGEDAKIYLASLGITGPYFCVALRDWKHSPPQLEREVAAFADYMVETYGYQALFVPLQTMRPFDDTEISQRVVDQMKNPGLLMTLPKHADIHTIRGVVGNAAFVLGMRLHALIYAMGNGVPAIGLEYSPKIRQHMEYMGQRWHLPLERCTAEELKRYAGEMLANKAHISAEIHEAGQRAREKAAMNAELCVGLLA
jgi:polysaccharide pyruvyl transferase WcaK-like protein